MASPSSATGASTDPSQSTRSRNIIAIAFLLISGLYFTDTLLRATLKTFWYDELVTVYLCRLPSFHATWAAVLYGTDLNPPLFYLLTRWAQHFSGEGLIASRLPGVLGFWIFGVCLYCFTARRLGRLCGCIAALTPWFTLAHYYAYEARPHGALLGWCGLMLLCWQRSRDDRPARLWPPNLWLVGLFFSFLAGLLTHVYALFLAVPFLLVECDNLFHRRRIRLGTCFAILIPPFLVAHLYLQLTRHYLSGIKGGGLHIHPYEVVQHYLIAVFGPGLALFIILLALLAWWRSQGGQLAASIPSPLSMTREELVLALWLVVLPILGVVAAKISHGPYFDRYFLVSTAGYALFLAQVVATWRRRSFVARALIVTMLFFIAADTLIAAYCRWRHGDIDQVEPSSHIVFVPDPAKPFMRNASLLQDRSQLDILVTGHPDYLYIQYYASPELRRRLYFAAPDTNEMFLHSYQQLSHVIGAGLQTTTLDDSFFTTHPDFLVYQSNAGICEACTEKILAAGFTLRSVQPDIDGELQHFSK
jgi:hypothetical protein